MFYPDVLLIGSHNTHKVSEFKQSLHPHFKTILSLNDLPEQCNDPEEIGDTFYQNAQIKADYYAAKSGLATLSDDSGLCIPALNNWPGVHTKRIAEQFDTPEQRFYELRKRLKNLSHEAIMTCVLVLRYPTGHSVMATGHIQGHLTFPAQGQGFGVDPLFIPDGEHLTFAQDPDMKNRLSHRVVAINNLINCLHR